MGRRGLALAWVNLAEAGQSDLIVLGSTPRYVARRAFFGPTTDLVLARSPCAVAVYAGGVRPAALRATAPTAAAGAAEGPAPAPS